METSYYRPKSADQLTFTDNGMFQAVLHEPGVCAELVERLLGIKVKKVEYPELEKTIARYYQSMVDCDSLMKGDNYTKLNESYILFICKYDPFKDASERKFGLSRYTFRNVCDENKDVNLNDKTLKIFYNASAYETERDEKIRAFLKFVCTNDPGEDEYSNSLFATVEKLKANEKFLLEYAAMNIYEMDLRREEAKKAARNMLNLHVGTPEQIVQITGLSLEQVQELKKELDAQPSPAN